MADLPVVCTLLPPELRAREEGVLRRMKERIEEVKELEDGYALRFPAEDETLAALFEVIQLERKCCAFLRFRLVVTPGEGPVWLELTGPEGSKAILESAFVPS